VNKDYHKTVEFTKQLPRSSRSSGRCRFCSLSYRCLV